MGWYFFPKDDPDFKWVISISPLYWIACPEKPYREMSAEEYLAFAREDLSHGGQRGLVNALGNAKRCFHYQTDRLLYRFGLQDATSRSRFPDKLALLRDLNIVSGTLLRVFNRERNAMEHEYIAPTQEVVEGSIDLCELFLGATERYLNGTPGRLRVVLADDKRDLIFQLEPGCNRVEKFVVLGSTPEETEHGTIYKEPLFAPGGEKLVDGLSVEPLIDEDIPLTRKTRTTWLQILLMFSATALGTRWAYF
jgi:hypothetical protein